VSRARAPSRRRATVARRSSERDESLVELRQQTAHPRRGSASARTNPLDPTRVVRARCVIDAGRRAITDHRREDQAPRALHDLTEQASDHGAKRSFFRTPWSIEIPNQASAVKRRGTYEGDKLTEPFTTVDGVSVWGEPERRPVGCGARPNATTSPGRCRGRELRLSPVYIDAEDRTPAWKGRSPPLAATACDGPLHARRENRGQGRHTGPQLASPSAEKVAASGA
jgi:hypothetical protein